MMSYRRRDGKIRRLWVVLCFGAFSVILITPQPAGAHPHNSVDIIVPPSPVFPDGAAVPGRCDVRFNISNHTQINVESAECSDYIFCKPSRVAVEAASLIVVDNDGEEGVGNAANVVYPLEFTFGVPSQRQHDWISEQPLFQCAQAMMF